MNTLRTLFLPLIFAASLFSQSPVTQVMATLTVKPGIDRQQIVKTMPQEVSDTVKLYLDGKILQWYARADGKGVVFILNCKDVSEAKALTDQLPLIKADFAAFEFMPLTPLTPLRYLLQPAK